MRLHGGHTRPLVARSLLIIRSIEWAYRVVPPSCRSRSVANRSKMKEMESKSRWAFCLLAVLDSRLVDNVEETSQSWADIAFNSDNDNMLPHVQVVIWSALWWGQTHKEVGFMMSLVVSPWWPRPSIEIGFIMIFTVELHIDSFTSVFLLVRELSEGHQPRC